MSVFDSAAGELRLVGGRLAVDFVNTVGGRKTLMPRPRSGHHWAGTVLNEKLNTYTDLLSWGLHTEIITNAEAHKLIREADRRKADATTVLQRALVFREAIYEVFKALVAGAAPSPHDLAILNEELVKARIHERIVRTADRFIFEWDNAENALDRVLWPIATSAAEFLTAPDLARLRECGGEDCGWLFIDTSRNRSRQWCYMQGCGNLAKVRRFRKRVKAAKKAK